jgi:hypothetical protein
METGLFFKGKLDGSLALPIRFPAGLSANRTLSGNGLLEVTKRIGSPTRVTRLLLIVLEQAGPVRDDGYPERAKPELHRQLCEKAAKFCRRFELRHRVELFERAGKRI